MHLKDELLSGDYSPVSGYWETFPLCAETEAVAKGSFKTKEPPEIRGSGYVVESLEAALWAFGTGNSFREGCLLAVNLGDDADTTGAVYGQLAGAYYGLDVIPAGWWNAVTRYELIIGLADRIYAQAVLRHRGATLGLHDERGDRLRWRVCNCSSTQAASQVCGVTAK